ncbi:unnamed protein product [Ceratitis capitata]|uniref:(Mediterranean fruit fly) hypothetical protein n=1 Tax=Ceratitis capitata TaxID=7213 RepID=A0A811V5S4_CERCA|nr:unnamed protein product [Ceratitis capitata]
MHNQLICGKEIFNTKDNYLSNECLSLIKHQPHAYILHSKPYGIDNRAADTTLKAHKKKEEAKGYYDNSDNEKVNDESEDEAKSTQRTA